MNGNLIKACECVSVQKMALLLKSHLISESQMEKSKMNVPWCHNNKRMSVCSDVCLQRVEKRLC